MSTGTRKSIVVCLAVAAGLFLVRAWVPAPFRSPALARHTAPARHTIEIRNLQFEPPLLRVTSGDTVAWRNGDIFPHTASSDSVLETGTISAGETAVVVLLREGRYEYICGLHPSMKGTVVVVPRG